MPFNIPSVQEDSFKEDTFIEKAHALAVPCWRAQSSATIGIGVLFAFF
jgi:hypothetical protein